jgi:outer membrane protein assembly factor BamB
MVRRFALPPAQDPFVNTPLISLGPGADGAERFWITSWNSVSGTQAIMITEDGREEIHRFPDDPGFYSAGPQDADTLWLCGDLATMIGYDLRSRAIRRYATGAPYALMFGGMIVDPASGRSFGLAFPPPTPTAISFDFRNGRPGQVFPGICAEHYSASHFANGDGTFTLLAFNPDLALLRWDPATDTVTKTLASELLGRPVRWTDRATISATISDDDGHVYLPEIGWYDPIEQRLVPGPEAGRRMNWFARRGDVAWGTAMAGELLTVARWDLKTGQLTELCRIPDGTVQGTRMTASGRIVAVTMFGTFYAIDAEDGSLLLAKHVPTDSIGHVDCLRRIDADRLLGTTFITQRFWSLDLRTGVGEDLGRAAPGGGEVLQTWKVGTKIYLAAYTGAELVEYDPDRPARFPENPRIVAKPSSGMRPVAAADDGRLIFYSSNHHYGDLGCVLTRYDTETGLATYADDPLPGQAIRSLVLNADGTVLVAGTAMEADCQSAPPSDDHCLFARIDAKTLGVITTTTAPLGTTTARVHGPIADDRYLATIAGTFDDHDQTRWLALGEEDHRSRIGIEDTHPLPDRGTVVVATEIAGLFVLKNPEGFALWDFRGAEPTRLATVCDDPTAYSCQIHDGSIHVLLPDAVLVDDELLSAFTAPPTE